MPLLAAGLASALAPGALVVTGPVERPDHPAARVLISDLPTALAALASDRPQPGVPWTPWRCLVVSLETGGCQARQALKHGVLGCVEASCRLEELQYALSAVRRGQRYLCAATAARLAEASVEEALTPRETQVLQLLCLGLDNKSIAQRLDMALGTVKTHVKAILDKLGASSRTQAVAAAHRRGLAVAEACMAHLPPRGYVEARRTGATVQTLREAVSRSLLEPVA
jgi:DNA-binding NarL/FixJ family response regulator